MAMNNDTNTPNASKIDRLFIAEYEHAKDWTGGKRNILSSIKEGDFYLIFKTGKSFIPSPMFQQIIEDMDTYKEVYDVEELGDADYSVFIKSKIDRFSNENTNVYFLSMESMFDTLKEKLTNVANVQSCKNFRVGRVTNKKKTVMGQDKEQKKESKSDNSDLFSGMHDVIDIDDVSVHADVPNFITVDEMDNIEPPIQKEEKSIKQEKKDEDKSFVSVEELLNETSLDNDNNQKMEPNSKININTSETKEPVNANVKKEKKKEEKPKLNLQKDYENVGVKIEKDLSSQGVNVEKDLSKSGVNVKKEEVKKEKEKKGKIESSIDYSAISDMLLEEEDPMKIAKGIKDAEQKAREQKQPQASRPTGVQGSAPPPPRPPRPQRGGAPQFGQKRPMPGSGSSGDNLTIQELEKQIFGGKQASMSFDKTYTELDDNKAILVNSLMERLINNINKFAKKILEYNFNRAKYIELITTLVKSIDYNDFLDSWDIIEPGYPLLIDEKVYNSLKDEAKYYSKVCETLYENDSW